MPIELQIIRASEFVRLGAQGQLDIGKRLEDCANPKGIPARSPGLSRKAGSNPGCARADVINPEWVASGCRIGMRQVRPQPFQGWGPIPTQTQGSSQARSPGQEDTIPLGLRMRVMWSRQLRLRPYRYFISAVLAAAALLTGCQTTPKVNTETKAGADFSRYHTFDLLPLPQAAPPSDPGLMLRISGPARRAIIESLTAKGFTEAPREQADFSANLRGQSLPKVEVTDMGFHYPVYTRYGRVNVVRNPYTSVDTYEERTLSIEIYDNKSKDSVWVGWSTARASGPVKVEQLTNAIQRILFESPPKPRAPKQ